MAILLSDSYKVISWDLNSKMLDTVYWGKTTDSGRGVKVAINQNGVLKTPTTETMRINFKKPSGLTVFSDGVISGNYFVFDFTEQVYAEQGNVLAELMLNVGGEFVMSSTFIIEVNQSFTSAIESSAEFTALQTALADVDQMNNDISALENPTFTEASALANVNSGESQATLWGKVKKMFSFIGTTTLTTTGTTISTAINELNTNLSRNFLNNSKNFKQAKMEYGTTFATFTNGVCVITLTQTYTDAQCLAIVLSGVVSNTVVSGNQCTITAFGIHGDSSLSKLVLNGQSWVKWYVMGY